SFGAYWHSNVLFRMDSQERFAIQKNVTNEVPLRLGNSGLTSCTVMLDCAHILLAEDDENDVVLMRRAFNKARVINPLEVVSDGEAVIAYLNGDDPYRDREKHPLPCLLLLDLKMPKKNGFEVLSWI